MSDKDSAAKAKYEQERDGAYEALNKDQGEYDRQLLTLSAGFLVLSLAFIKDIAPLHEAQTLWLLYGAWGFLCLCVLLVLGSFQYSIHGQLKLAQYWKRSVDLLDAKEDAKQSILEELSEAERSIDRHAKQVRWLNVCSGAVFLIGAIGLVVFVISNIQHEAHSRPASNQTPATLTQRSSSESIAQKPQSTEKAISKKETSKLTHCTSEMTYDRHWQQF